MLLSSVTQLLRWLMARPSPLTRLEYRYLWILSQSEALLGKAGPSRISPEVLSYSSTPSMGHWHLPDCYDTDSYCAYDFFIANSTAGPEYYCQIVDTYTQGSVSQHSWYGQPCLTNGDWVISWGYNSVHDSAVMTVLSSPLHEDAFFGWDNVSASYSLADQGPNTVYAVGSFSGSS